jgi:hypothetical protein
MIISILITGFMVMVLVVAFFVRRIAPKVSVIAYILAGLGTFFSWNPEYANNIALWLGIGRGADLISYIWISISFLAILLLFLRLRLVHTQITLLARTVALSGVKNDLHNTDTTLDKP